LPFATSSANTRRSITTLSTIAIGAYITDIQYGVQTGAVQGTGHLQVFRNGYFHYGTRGASGLGIDRYQDVLRLIREDPELKQLTAVVTPSNRCQELRAISRTIPQSLSSVLVLSRLIATE